MVSNAETNANNLLFVKQKAQGLNRPAPSNLDPSYLYFSISLKFLHWLPLHYYHDKWN